MAPSKKETEPKPRTTGRPIESKTGEKRSEFIGVKLTPTELRRVEGRAAEKGLPLSTYVRRKALGERV